MSPLRDSAIPLPDLARSILLVAIIAGVPAVQSQSGDAPTFGTTVVDTGGFRGTIFYLNPGTGILPDTFRRLKPKGSLYTRALNVPPRHFLEGFPGVTSRFEWFAIDYNGKFWIERPSLYNFALTSDDGSLLYIDDRLLIDNDRLHPPITKEGSVQLDRGAHNIRVSYFQGPRDSVALILEIAGAGEPFRVFSMDEFRPHAD